MKLETLFAKAGRAKADIRLKMLSINAEVAQSALTNFNNSNRKMSLGLAKLYANEFLRGEWKTNGEPLIFSVDDKGVEHLVSGQHRLMALVIVQKILETQADKWPVAQTSMDVPVIYGVDHTSADTIDIGKARNHGDVLFRDPWVDKMIPEAWNSTISKRALWTKTLAGAARLVWLIEGGNIVSSAPKFLISEMLTFLQNKHNQLPQAVTMVLDANDADGDNHGLKMSLSYLAALSYVGSIIESTETEVTLDLDILDKFDGFLNQLAVGTGFDKGDPAHALTGYWNKLVSEVGSKDRDRDWVGPFIKASKLMLDGATGVRVSDISLTKKERQSYADFPVMFDGFQTECFERTAKAKAEVAAQKAIIPPSSP